MVNCCSGLLKISGCLFLAGCATFTVPVYEPYWKPNVYVPYIGKPDIREVVDIAPYCQSTTAAGCWIVGTPIVYVKAGLSARDRECVLHHEIEAHMKRGYGHGKGAMAVDHCASFLKE